MCAIGGTANYTTHNTHQLPPTTMDLADRIRDLLGHGLSNSIVASTVGCDPSYISQLMEDEDFRNSVLIKRAQGAERAIGRDDRWNNIEDKALEKMEQLLPLVTRPSDVIRIASMANAAKRSAKDLASGAETASPTVQLVLPQSAIIHFQMNAAAQVVEVEGRSLAALPTKHLQSLMKERQQQALEDKTITDVSIPTAVTSERKKIVSTLEAIGAADIATPVPNILEPHE